MVGNYRVRVKNSHNTFTFELKRNITVLRGLSGRGKSTLFEMIRDYNQFGKASSVSVSCDKEVYALEGEDWLEKLERRGDAIIVIDEDSRFITSRIFANCVKGSDNYYLIISRNFLPMLPFSVEEIYELSGAKNKKFEKIYQERERMYQKPAKHDLPFLPEIIITEDSNAGFDFFQNEAKRMGIECISAGGNSKIYSLLKEYDGKKIVVIADGAAFGPYMDNIVKEQEHSNKKLAIFLPESFEWLVLKSGIVKNIQIKKIEEPEQYADSRKYMSWEQYFTDLLEQATKNSRYMKYNKKKLAKHYFGDNVAKGIKDEMKGINLSIEN